MVFVASTIRSLSLPLIVAGAVTFMLPGIAAAAAASPPDFSGVYYPIFPAMRPPPAPTGPAGSPPPRPRGMVLPVDASGRPLGLPPLNEEYLARYDEVAKSRKAGSSDTDATLKCLPPGMPSMMSMAYGMEVMQTRDKITMFSEWMDALRRIYLDGRKPTQKELDDPTYAGYSTGHWEGDTLVVETVAMRADAPLDGFGSSRSDASRITERIRFIEPGKLEDRITVHDPKALTKPWEIVHTYRKASPPKDQLREFACAEGLENAH